MYELFSFDSRVLCRCRLNRDARPLCTAYSTIVYCAGVGSTETHGRRAQPILQSCIVQVSAQPRRTAAVHGLFDSLRIQISPGTLKPDKPRWVPLQALPSLRIPALAQLLLMRAIKASLTRPVTLRWQLMLKPCPYLALARCNTIKSCDIVYLFIWLVWIIVWLYLYNQLGF